MPTCAVRGCNNPARWFRFGRLICGSCRLRFSLDYTTDPDFDDDEEEASADGGGDVDADGQAGSASVARAGDGGVSELPVIAGRHRTEDVL